MFTFSWEPKQSQCSVECGKGTQNVSYSCVQTFALNKSTIVVDDSNCPSKMSLPKKQDCLGSEGSCTQENRLNNVVLSMVIIICIALFLFVLYKLVMKVLLASRELDSDTEMTVLCEKFDEIPL